MLHGLQDSQVLLRVRTFANDLAGRRFHYCIASDAVGHD